MSERKRSRQICIRLTDEEFALWQKKLKASGLSQTDYLVKVLSNSVVKVYTIREDLQPLFTELRHIGGNINQLAYLSNIGQTSAVYQSITRLQYQHSAIVSQIMKFLNEPKFKKEIIR